MEIGLENERDGITYHELIAEIERRTGNEFTKFGECTFMHWFLENYSTPFKPNSNKFYDRYKPCVNFVKRKHGVSFAHEENQQIDTIKRKVLDIKTFLNGEAAKKYIDYQELVEARESSRKAISKANVSIWIAIVGLVLSILFSILNLFQEPKNIELPEKPLEVNVINNPNIDLTLRLIDSLRFELQKADFLISIYEGDSIDQNSKMTKPD